MSRIESAMRVVLAFNEAFNRHDVAGMMQLVSDDFIFESSDPAADGALYSGKEAVTQFWQDYFCEFPDAQVEIEEIFGLGMRCVRRWRNEWTDGAGKKRQVRGVDLFQVKDDLITEMLSYVKG